MKLRLVDAEVPSENAATCVQPSLLVKLEHSQSHLIGLEMPKELFVTDIHNAVIVQSASSS